MFPISLVASAVFVCTPIAVWDGDGPIWCAEGPKIRIANISARELDDTCRRGHPCPTSSGVEARDALVRLLGVRTGTWDSGHIEIRGAALRCSEQGKSYGRIVASCSLADGRDLGRAMIASGTVAKW